MTDWRRTAGFICCFSVIAALVQPVETLAADWPLFGRDATRNAVVTKGNAPTDWDVANGRNIKWRAKLGSTTFAAPVVSDGHVYIGTNNGAGYLERYPAKIDLGCLLCFRESDGQFLWQYSAPKLPTGRVHDWPLQGLVSSPLVEGKRLWFVSNRHEVVCLDTMGFRDEKNDGPYVTEPVIDSREADVLWKIDLIQDLGVFPHPPGMGPNTRCSIAASDEHRIYVVTGNGVDDHQVGIPASEAPSLICLDKDTGKVLWTDASPGKNILSGQWSHPLVAKIDGRTQVVVPQGDGWVRSFDGSTGKLIWTFDLNHKESKWAPGQRRSTRNTCLATPVLDHGRVYVASGMEAEMGEGPGRLVCLDPTKTGDISSDLAVDKNGTEIAHRRVQAIDPEQGDRAVPNPNSGLVWEFERVEGSKEFTDQMHRTLSTVAIHDGLVFALDFSGLVHCLDANSGQKYWSLDTFAAIWASPLIVDGLVYLGREDGLVSIFRLSKDPNVAMTNDLGMYQPIAQISMAGPDGSGAIYSSPIFANDVLFIATRNELFAIAAPNAPQKETTTPENELNSSLPTEPARVATSRVAKSIFAPTPQDIVERMLESVEVTKKDTVVDLGSGDGRIVITAASRHGAKAIGYEIDAELAASSRANAKQAGVQDLVEIRSQDFYGADLSTASVVTVFLYPATLKKLLPQFAAMPPGARIVSHHYAIPGAQPERIVTVKSKETGDEHVVHVYTTPLSRPADVPR